VADLGYPACFFVGRLIHTDSCRKRLYNQVVLCRTHPVCLTQRIQLYPISLPHYPMKFSHGIPLQPMGWVLTRNQYPIYVHCVLIKSLFISIYPHQSPINHNSITICSPFLRFISPSTISYPSHWAPPLLPNQGPGCEAFPRERLHRGALREARDVRRVHAAGRYRGREALEKARSAPAEFPEL
jgi:hypothetical protein